RPQQSLGDLFRQVQDSQSRLMSHQHLGLTQIQQIAGVGELFDTLTVFANYPVDPGTLPAQAGGIRLTNLSGRRAPHYPLTCVVLAGRQLHLRLDYGAALFGRGRGAAGGRRRERLLAAAVARPDASIGSLEILAGSERRQLLEDWNATSHVVGDASLPELYAA